jgi:aryl-alcohol dehydrogenase-like predicted oxidoreductase
LRYRQLGDSDLQVSEICLGTWTTFGGSLADDAAMALVDAAFDAGINFFDTANTYSEGRSEEVLGRALSTRPRDSYVLATKLRARAPDGGSGVSRAQVQRLRPIADGLGITTAQLALAWILREPNVASAIVGSSRPEQLRDNAAASDVDLDQATMRAAEAALAPM